MPENAAPPTSLTYLSSPTARAAEPPAPKRLVLASGSPRRRELIAALDIDALIVGSGDDEDAPRPGEDAAAYVRRIALGKAKYALSARAADFGPNAAILGADTSVALDSEIMGKPTDEADIFRMLRALRGRAHRVVTGIAVIDAASGNRAVAHRESVVHMRQYADAEIAAYAASGEPWDKAGAYAAQDKVFNPAQRIDGCYTNVLGLPLCDTLSLLSRMDAAARIKPEWRIPDDCEDCARWAAMPMPRAKRRNGRAV